MVKYQYTVSARLRNWPLEKLVANFVIIGELNPNLPTAYDNEIWEMIARVLKCILNV